MNTDELIQDREGIELPAAGVWEIPAGQAAAANRPGIGRWAELALRTLPGQLAVADDGSIGLELAFEGVERGSAFHLEFAGRLVAADRIGSLRFAGAATIDGSATPMELGVVYRGVHRHGAAPVAWLGILGLESPTARGRFRRRLRFPIRAEVNAERRTEAREAPTTASPAGEPRSQDRLSLVPPPAPPRRIAAQAVDRPRSLVVGAEARVPVIGGRSVRYVNLDNAASTPPLRSVAEAVTDLLPWYASVHRGAGHKSRLSTTAYETARRRVGAFFGADPERDVVIFGKNTTEAINKLAHRLALEPDAVLLSTLAEHHSNSLPWRLRAKVEHIEVTPTGDIDEDDLQAKLGRHRGRVALVAVTGASNVTGVVPPIHRIAERCHEAGAQVLVDAAQLAPHRAIDMRAHDDAGHIDYLAISGHKLYAPFGTGALIGPRATFDRGDPEYPGGGTVKLVTRQGVVWDDAPARDEAGSPNVIGAVALGVALASLDEIGMDQVTAREHALLGRLLDGLAAIDGVTVHGPGRAPVDRVGVVPFVVDGIDHRLVAARLAHEHGVGVRSGCFCAQPLVAALLGTAEVDSASWVPPADGARPGLVRASLGCYSEPDDVDRLLAGLRAITTTPAAAGYDLDAEQQFQPVGHREWLPREVRRLTA